MCAHYHCINGCRCCNLRASSSSSSYDEHEHAPVQRRCCNVPSHHDTTTRASLGRPRLSDSSRYACRITGAMHLDAMTSRVLSPTPKSIEQLVTPVCLVKGRIPLV